MLNVNFSRDSSESRFVDKRMFLDAMNNSMKPETICNGNIHHDRKVNDKIFELLEM